MLGGSCSPCCENCTSEFLISTWDALVSRSCTVSLPDTFPVGVEATTAQTALAYKTYVQPNSMQVIPTSFACRYWQQPVSPSGEHSLALDVSRSTRGQNLFFTYVSDGGELEMSAQVVMTASPNTGFGAHTIPNSKCYIGVGFAMSLRRKLYWVPSESVQSVVTSNTVTDSSISTQIPYETYEIASLTPQYAYQTATNGWWSDTENKRVIGFSGAWEGDFFNTKNTSQVGFEVVYGNGDGYQRKYNYQAGFGINAQSVSMSPSELVAVMPQESPYISRPEFVDPPTGISVFRNLAYSGRIETAKTLREPAVTYTTTGGKVFQYGYETCTISPTIRLS